MGLGCGKLLWPAGQCRDLSLDWQVEVACAFCEEDGPSCVHRAHWDPHVAASLH